MALPQQFGHLATIIDPDDLRALFDASVEHRVTLFDGDRENLLPGLHARLSPGHRVGQQFVVLQTTRGYLVVSGDRVHGERNLTGHKHDGVYVPLNNAVGSVWGQPRTMDRINDAIHGDLSRFVILHDMERWRDMPLEVEGFRIVRAR